MVNSGYLKEQGSNAQKSEFRAVISPKSTAAKPRIELLDSFRFLAIILVVLFHYFYSKRNTEGLYPYGDQYGHIFKHGNIGVQLFFKISGFVIFMTIEKCKTLKEFLVRRFIRLCPLLF